MRKRLLPTLLLLILIGLAWIAVLNSALGIQISPETGNYEGSYTFTVQNGFYQSDHVLYVSLLPSLYGYYYGKSHAVYNENEYPKFVTPDVVKSIAENIRSITRNTPYDDEEFANAVLTIVHQIPYVRNDAKYPVETLANNQADCDGLSILAASIMKAGGLDVVLLLYNGINPSHMNVGVSLESMPVSHSWWMAPSGIDYDNKTYWIAECTSLADWTVGTRPDLLSQNKPEVIPLENCEKESPASISSSLNPMQPSSISINLSTRYSNFSGGDERTINISGSISPAFPNESVALYVSQPGLSPSALIRSTDDFGNYAQLWDVTLPGTYIVQTCWSGHSNFSGSESEKVTVFVGAQQQPIDASSGYLSTDDSNAAQSWLNSPAYLALLSQSGKEFLKSSLPGPNIVLSGDFMILSDGHELTPNETTITIPAHQVTFRLPRSRQTAILEVPEKTITLPGAELLNSQFGFILKSDGADNYTASVKLLTDNDVSQITQSLDESNALVMNASEVAAKNTWRKAIAKVSNDGVAIEVYDENGTRLDSMSQSAATKRYGELGILMTYPVGQVLAFKNLKVESLSQSSAPDVPNPAPIGQNQTQGNGIDFLFPYLRYSLLLAGAGLAILCIRGRKRRKVSFARDQEQLTRKVKTLGSL
jgi:hypothetical protein